MGIAIALSVLFGLTLLLANHAGWLTTTVLNEDRFVSTLAPLPKDEAVSLALAQRTADRVIESFEVTETISETLPDELSFIAGPLTTGVRDLTAKAAVEIIRSDAFTTVWTGALTGAHKIATAYVGVFDDGAVVAQDGVAVLDLTAIADQIVEDLDGRGFGLLENTDRDLTIELFELPDSGLIKAIADVMTSVRWIVMILTLALLIASAVVATDRRRISIWLGGAAVVSMAAALIEVRLARGAMTGGIEDPIQKAGAESAWDIIFQQFVWQSWVVLLLAVLVIFVAWAMGSSSGAASVRSAVSSTGDSVFGGDSDSPAVRFIAAHSTLVEVGAAILIGGFLLVGPRIPLWGVVIAIVILGAIVASVEYLSGSVADGEQSAEHPSELVSEETE
jgi:hypothetical protein